MGTYKSVLSTAGPVLQNSRGFINVARSSYLFTGTASASQNFIMTPLPGGARVVDLALSMEGDISPLATVQVKDSLAGGIYITSATAEGAHFHRMNGLPSATWRRMTASANLYVVLRGAGDSASSGSSLNFSLVTQYLTREDPDG